MNSPFFSVIIPTLNEERYLPILLKSLSKQTLTDFEVIVADAKSEDRTANVFHKFKKILPSARFLISEKKSAGYQRNMGARQAKGTYLVFLDADCDIEPTFMEELHVACLKQNFPFATTWIKPDSNKTNDQIMLLLGNLVQELAKAVNRQYSGGYNTIVKRDIFLKLGGFMEDMKINEDCEFAIRAQKKGIEVTILKEPQVVFSLRRFRSFGTLPILRKYAQAQINFLIDGPLSNIVFDYPMGGHVHVKKVKSQKLKVKSYLKKLDRLQKKLVRLLVE